MAQRAQFVELEVLIRREVRMRRVDARIEDRPHNAFAAGAVGDVRRIGFHRRDRFRDEGLDVAVFPDLVNRDRAGAGISIEFDERPDLKTTQRGVDVGVRRVRIRAIDDRRAGARAELVEISSDGLTGLLHAERIRRVEDDDDVEAAVWSAPDLRGERLGDNATDHVFRIKGARIVAHGAVAAKLERHAIGNLLV